MSTRNETPSDRDDAFVARVRAVLDAGDKAVDSSVADRLAAVRRAAVAALDVPRAAEVARWIPASAAAGMLVAVGMFAWSVRIPDLPVFDDDEAVLAAQDLDLLDDIEFVAWMVEQDGDDAA
jgi:hypothetical protein